MAKTQGSIRHWYKSRSPDKGAETLSLKEYGLKYRYSVSGLRYKLHNGDCQGFKIKGKWRVYDVPPNEHKHRRLRNP